MSGPLYIKFEKNMSVRTREVRLGDVADLDHRDPAVVNRLKTMKLFSFQDIRKGHHVCAARQVYSVFEVVEKIHAWYPNLEVQNLGETDFVVEYSTKERESMPLLFLKVALVCVIIFFGSAFSIMTFNNDVSVTRLFAQLYEWLTGEVSDGFTVLEFTYSLGLTLGIVVFFNHLGGRRLTKDPTPIEVEMRMYEDDVDTTLIRNAVRNGRHKQ